MEKKIINPCLTLNNDDEWYTTREDVEEFLSHLATFDNMTFWCPFDTEDSNFVKVLKERGYKVIASHIDNGQDFYKYEPTDPYDIIISNPPFKGKSNLIARLLELKNVLLSYLAFSVSTLGNL